MPVFTLSDFLSSHTTPDKVVEIQVEPDVVYVEPGRDAQYLNFDFILQGLTEKTLTLGFLKVAVYDASGSLLTYRYLNHNGVGTPGIHTLGKFQLAGQAHFDLFNPFYQFPKDMPIDCLRYMFTFVERETRQEYYDGTVVVTPQVYHQQTRLCLPLRGPMTILDGHDYTSHHRRFGMSLVREVTQQQFVSNFSRYAVDFALVGPDGNLRAMAPEERHENYDFHFTDVCKFYTHEAPVYAPAAGVVVAVENALPDLYTTAFDMDAAIRAHRVADLAGNCVIIQHTDREFSHLFHLLQGSVCVDIGQQVSSGQYLGRVGFSGAATTYSHLHYQLMDGPDFLRDNALPCQFSDVMLWLNGKVAHFDKVALDTSDFILGAEPEGD
ncbi:MAG: M23 family metallopeptidase [Anaerolineae bacterium]|nr:M23 family metallopeptidase [Anaerolineae bacterium]